MVPVELRADTRNPVVNIPALHREKAEDGRDRRRTTLETGNDRECPREDQPALGSPTRHPRWGWRREAALTAALPVSQLPLVGCVSLTGSASVVLACGCD